MPLWVSTGAGSAAGTEWVAEMDLPPVQMTLASLRAMKHGEFRLNEELACCSEYEVSSQADGCTGLGEHFMYGCVYRVEVCVRTQGALERLQQSCQCYKVKYEEFLMTSQCHIRSQSMCSSKMSGFARSQVFPWAPAGDEQEQRCP